MPNIIPPQSARAVAVHSVRRFIAEHLEDLSEASLLLGGPAAQRRFLRLVSRVRKASRLEPHLRRELRWLHGVLTLELVGDPHATDPNHFCDIHPDDPMVDGLCRLADAMTELLFALPIDPEHADLSVTAKDARDAA